MVDSERAGGTLAPATVSTMGASAADRLADLDLVAVFEEAFEEGFEEVFGDALLDLVADETEVAGEDFAFVAVLALVADAVLVAVLVAALPASATFGSRAGVAAFSVFAAALPAPLTGADGRSEPFAEARFTEPPFVVLAGAVRRAEGTFAIDRTVYRNRGPGSNGSL
jgi:hypothetical protein